MSEPRLIRLVRAIDFNAALRYFDSSLSIEANRDLYGSLYRDKDFGANFRLEASFVGSVDPLTGMIVNLVDVDRWLKSAVSNLDGRFLNEIFGGKTPTPERIARAAFEELDRLLKAEAPASARLEKVRLFEGESLSVTYSRFYD